MVFARFRRPVRSGGALDARAEAARWAAQVATRPEVVYLDTETTGFGSRAEIVEIAVIGADGAVLLDTLVRPDGRIPHEAFMIHGIDDGMVAAAPRWAEVCPLLAGALRERRVVVYNAAFDLQMVNQANQRCGAALYPASWECAMLRYAAFAGEWNSKYGNYRWHRLDVALATFGGTRSGHRAAADAQACRHVVLGMSMAAG
jgi:DNA polymerase III subunit epsilon